MCQLFRQLAMSPGSGCGRICIGRRKINLSTVFAGQHVGITEVSEKIWLVSFMDYDLGFFDHDAGCVDCAENAFVAKVLPMSPARARAAQCKIPTPRREWAHHGACGAR
jgi:hypothetical protein